MSNQNYKLLPDDMRLWLSLLDFQNLLGPQTPVLNDQGALQFTGWIDSITSTSNPSLYEAASNPQVKAWIDDLFQKFIQLETSYANRKFPEVLLVYKFNDYTADSWCISCFAAMEGYIRAFAQGANSEVYYTGCQVDRVNPWDRPRKPDEWVAVINQTLLNWLASGIPADLKSLVHVSGSDTRPPGLAESTNVNKLKTTTTTLWNTQQSALTALQQQTALDDDDCVFVMFLLCSLGTGSVPQQQSVSAIISHTTNSIELPNDTFFNTLLYYAMMLWIDPIGNYKYNSNNIKFMLDYLHSVLVSNDPGTQAMKAGVTKNQQILNAVPTYPIMDPYNPAIGFNTRKSDILEAINSAWPCR